MNINRLACNHLENPLGFKMDQAVLSWVTACDSAADQDAAQVEVAADEAFNQILFDSEKQEDIDSICYTLPLKLDPRTRYFWRVTVWAGQEKATSAIAWFETAKGNQPWQASWITSENSHDVNAAYRKVFSLENKPIAKARLYATAAGVYEVYINGTKAGKEYLAPFCNQYSQWLQYQTYDITDMLAKGENAIGALVGEGWYRGRFGLGGGMEDRYGDVCGLLCEAVIDYEDGSQTIIGTDNSWLTAPSFITDSSIYDGETEDLRLAIPGWSEPGSPNQTSEGQPVNWQFALPLDINMDLLTERLSVPVIVKETRQPQAVLTTPAGETVLDMGQNMVGGFELAIDLPAGETIELKFGEILQHGNFYQDNLRTAKQTFTCIADGQPKVIRPYFTFFGYRYVKVSGWQQDPDKLKEAFTGTVIYSDMKQTGQIETSNPKVNQLFANAMWGQKGNFLDVPTDCPQRDERMGWTGDAQVFCGTASFNMDTYAFFRKFLYDTAKEQAINDGKVPVVVPCMHRSYDQSSAWADATTIIPWTMYVQFGDPAILKEHFPAMKAYVESIRAEDKDNKNLWTPAFTYGDWLAQDGKDPFSYFGGTDHDLISTAYYCYSASLTAKAAAVLGYDQEASIYSKLVRDIREAYQREFFTPSGRLAVETQTAAVVSLFMDLAGDECRERTINQLYKLLKTNNFYLKTGFVGTPYLCRVLSDHGYNDLAYRLLLNEEAPSWLYCVNMGATTIWERWNSVLPNGLLGELGMNSLNHYAYGSIVEWMYRNMCGLQPLETYPGFRRIRLAPQPDGRLRQASAWYDSPVGRYAVAWEIKKNGYLSFDITIPFGGSANLVLPDSDMPERLLTRGRYHFEYKPNRSYAYYYSTYTHTVKQLMAVPEVAKAAEAIMPGVTATMEKNSMAGYRLGLFRDMVGIIMFPYSSEDLDKLDQAIRDIPVPVT